MLGLSGVIARITPKPIRLDAPRSLVLMYVVSRACAGSTIWVPVCERVKNIESYRQLHSIFFTHSQTGTQMVDPAQALETTYMRTSERGASRRIGFGVIRAITPLKPSISRLGSCR